MRVVIVGGLFKKSLTRGFRYGYLLEIRLNRHNHHWHIADCGPWGELFEKNLLSGRASMTVQNLVNHHLAHSFDTGHWHIKVWLSTTSSGGSGHP